VPNRSARKPPVQITYRAELGRKAIHLTSVLIPVVGFFTPWPLAVAILFAMASFSLLIDVLRTRRGWLGDQLRARFDYMIREHERHLTFGLVALSGATWLLAAASLSYLLFPGPVATAALLMLILCDTAAALVGRRYGTIRFGPKRKSVEGSFAFLVVAIIVAAATPGLPFIIGCIGAVAAMLAEAQPLEVDDNIAVPMAAGFAMQLAAVISVV
jgi:dolichol kinase